jgi:hypothetical protein
MISRNFRNHEEDLVILCFSEELNIIDEFSKRFKVSLRKVEYTYENGFPELMYHFSDNSGGYTIEGIRKSLE